MTHYKKEAVHISATYTALALATISGILLFAGFSPLGPVFLTCCITSWLACATACKLSQNLFNTETGSQAQHSTGNLLRAAAIIWMSLTPGLISLLGILAHLIGYMLVTRNHSPPKIDQTNQQLDSSQWDHKECTVKDEATTNGHTITDQPSTGPSI